MPVVTTSAVARALFLALVLSSAPPGLAQVPPSPVTDEGDATTDFVYHFDRNALTDSVQVEGQLFATTASGNLVAFQEETLALVGSWSFASPVTALARADGTRVLVGTRDGSILEVGVGFGVRRRARLDAAPLWLGRGRLSGGEHEAIVAVVQDPAVQGPGPRTRAAWTVRDVLTDASWTVDVRPDAAAFDGRGRLWLGADWGEWGGRVAVVDLESGEICYPVVTGADARPDSLDPPLPDGVHGFLGLDDGSVLAYGGTSHMRLRRAALWAASPTGLTPRWPPVASGRGAGGPVPSAGPTGPIIAMTEGPHGTLFLSSESRLLATATDFGRWRVLRELDLRTLGIRVDRRGRQLLSLHAFAGGSLAFTLATVDRGWLRLAGDAAELHELPDQLGLETAYRIERIPSATVLDGGREGLLWTLSSRGPRPHPTHPSVGFAEHRVLIGADGKLLTVSRSRFTPGAFALTAWEGESPAVVASADASSVACGDVFLTPDDRIWAARERGLSEIVADGAWPSAPTLESALPLGHDLRSVTGGAPPWVLLDHRHGGLWRFSYRPDGSARLIPLAIDLAGESEPVIRDALASSAANLLLATDVGLRQLDLETATITTAPGDPGVGLRAIARDGRGRIWLGGDGLFLLSTDGRTAVPVTGAPVPTRTVTALGASAEDLDTIVVGLAGCGVLEVRRP